MVLAKHLLGIGRILRRHAVFDAAGFVIMVFSSTEEVSVNGFAFSAEIMLLVMGIIFFPAGTRFGLSNGVSRKTVFCGMVLFLLALSVGMTLVNLLGQWAGSAMGIEHRCG